MNPLKHKFLPISFGISLFGLFFSMWNVLDFTESFCFATTSCTLFAEFALLGISFWWIGVAFFTVTLILALFGLAYLGKLLAGAGVFLDFLLLCIMFYTMPCINCLIVGAIITVTFFSFCYEGQRKSLPFPKPWLLLPWALVFCMICGNIIMSHTKLWPLVGDNSAKIHVYFSTECSACAQLVRAQGNRTDIAWYPVQEDDNDLWQIKFLVKEIKEGTGFIDAYDKMHETDTQGNIYDIFSLSHWKLQFALWKNAAYVVKGGNGRLPFVEFQGLPSQLLKHQNTDSKNPVTLNQNERDTIDSLLGDIEALCGDDEVPCPEDDTQKAKP